MSKKLLIVIGLIILAAGVTGYFLMHNDDKSETSQAQAIPPMSSLEQARELSKGIKPVCSPDSQQAIDAVAQHDSFVDEEKEFSRFEMTASEGIMDVPAGTNYDVTINSYDGKIAKGTVDYDGEYGRYNYTIERGHEAGTWSFVVMTACE